MLTQVLSIIYGGNFLGARHLKLEGDKKWRLLFHSWGKGVIHIPQLQAGKMADVPRQSAEMGGNSACPSPSLCRPQRSPSLSINYSRSRGGDQLASQLPIFASFLPLKRFLFWSWRQSRGLLHHIDHQ